MVCFYVPLVRLVLVRLAEALSSTRVVAQQNPIQIELVRLVLLVSVAPLLIPSGARGAISVWHATSTPGNTKQDAWCHLAST